MELPKIHINLMDPGWSKLTGHYGRHAFVDGRSVEPIPMRQALRIGAATLVHDDEGNVIHPFTYKMPFDPSNVPAPILTEVEEVKSESVVLAGKYSREELEAIADKRGIIGIREISDPLDIRGRSVAELIDEVLKKQPLE